jgi:hypothetical protein
MRLGIDAMTSIKRYPRLRSTKTAEPRRRQKYRLPCPRFCQRGPARALAVCALALVALDQACAQPPSEDATLACGRAATQAERDWKLPTGLLIAIGTIESGRRTGIFPMIWPWTINAEGHGLYQPNKVAAVDMVSNLQRRGVRVIDVGCFQVDLFYHPDAFANLEQAFDPDANAHAAARILSLGRLSSTGWDAAIAAYHSASPLVGADYLQRVRAVWPWTAAHPPWGQPDDLAAYAVLLSLQARLVRVVGPTDPAAAQTIELPRVISATPLNRLDRTEAAIQWLHQPVDNLPADLSAADSGSVRLPTTRLLRGGRQP